MTQARLHPGLQHLFEYWRRKKGDRPMPARADIDPTELPGQLWAHLMLIDVLHEGDRLRFRYRVVGSHFTEAYGSDITGRYMDEALPRHGPYRDYVAAHYAGIIASKRPVYSENLYTLAGQTTPMLTRRLTLPLSDDGATVNKILAAHFFEFPRHDAPLFGTRLSDFSELVRRDLPS